MISSLFVDTSVGRWVSGIFGSILAIFDPIGTIITLALEFVVIDFVVGVWASRVRAKRQNRLDMWGFESEKAWKTIYKAVFIVVGVVMCFQLDTRVLFMHDLHLANYFAGFCMGVEFWSVLENAACISDHQIFRYLKQFMGAKVKESGIDSDLITKVCEERKENKESK